MNIANWSVKNRAAVDILATIIIIGGIFSFFHIRYELIPEISFDVLQIQTILPGATPEDVEHLVTNPIEEEIIDLNGVDYVRSNSFENRSEIKIHLDTSAATMDELRRDVERMLDQVNTLPEDAEDPQLFEIKTESSVLVAALLGSAPWKTKKKIADRLERKFRSTPGVTSVIVSGLQEKEITVEVKPEKLASLHISSYDIVQAIKKARSDIPAGSMETKRGDIFIRSIDNLEAVSGIEKIVVKTYQQKTVQIKDIANIYESLADEKTRSRINGKPATILTVMKSRQGDVFEIAKEIKIIMEEEKLNLPANLELAHVLDFSVWIQERLDVAKKSGIWGFFLVLILLTVFLDLTSALWCAYGIPLSILGGTLILYFTGNTLNMITIFGFILVIGMLVDDAIIVVENVYRHREKKGVTFEEAIITGASEVAKPITAAVLTTMAALLPLALMSGDMGKFMAEIPKPGIFALATSLIEAVFLLPAHLYMCTHLTRPSFLSSLFSFCDILHNIGNTIIFPLRKFYLKRLSKAIRHRYISIGIIIFIFISSIFVGTKVLSFKLVATNDMPMFIVDVRAPAGTNLDEMQLIVEKIEKQLLTLPKEEIKAISTTIGFARDRHSYNYEKELAQITIELQKPEIRPRNAGSIMDDARKMFKNFYEAEVVINDMDKGPPVGKAIHVRLSGYNWNTLKKFTEEIKEYLQSLPGITGIDDSLKEGKPEIIIEPIPEKAAIAGTTPALIAAEIRSSIDGIEALEIRQDDSEVKIRVRYPKSFRQNENNLSHMNIPTVKGAVPLKNIAAMHKDTGWSSLYHYNGKKTIAITANILTNGIESRKAIQLIKKKFSQETSNNDLLLDFGGEAEATKESMKSLKTAALIGISLIAIILVFEFGNFLQPIAVLSALPLAIIGVIITLVLHTLLYKYTGIGLDAPMGLLPLIGMTALLGVIVNDSIIMVDFINKQRNSRKNRWHSILLAAKYRMRPVLLTSLTTSAGILPMSYTLRGSSAFLAPMAISFGWGLLFGTMLTLFVVPIFISILDDFYYKVKKINGS